ncbi:uncharacterized protein LOC113313110 [Papaver somniferum]|uniref:uncharacterized protein LOC113313110 n=1 Tax=Papaver somniferum TaxID=3469 RepID=UPI000E6F70BC|nr:uncharacterized protein LOC113313110 [Papaver somniferum]
MLENHSAVEVIKKGRSDGRGGSGEVMKDGAVGAGAKRSCLTLVQLLNYPYSEKRKNYNPTILRKHHYARLSPFKTLVTSKSNNTIDNYNLHEYAVIGVLGNFLGAQAKINIWTPFTEAHEMSISQIWVFSGEDKDLNTVEAGWHVYKDMYGDDQTRFFIYWTVSIPFCYIK